VHGVSTSVNIINELPGMFYDYPTTHILAVVLAQACCVIIFCANINANNARRLTIVACFIGLVVSAIDLIQGYIHQLNSGAMVSLFKYISVFPIVPPTNSALLLLILFVFKLNSVDGQNVIVILSFLTLITLFAHLLGVVVIKNL
jgi:hypothetical protein